MILDGVAPVEKRQGRCDGVGSGVSGGKPSVSRAQGGNAPRVLFCEQAYAGETLERRPCIE